MNRKKNQFLLVAVAFVLLFAGAGIFYKMLSQTYVPPSETDPQEKAPAAEPAPDFTVLDRDGMQVQLSDFLGRPVVINFWATWCSPCKEELPVFDRAAQEYGEEVAFLMVNLTDGGRDTVESVTEFVQENGYTFPLYFDTAYSAAQAYGVYAIPVTVLITEEGTLLDTRIGAVDEDTLMQDLEKLMSGTDS